MEWYVESVGSSVFCVDARHAGAIFPAEALEGQRAFVEYLLKNKADLWLE